MRAEFQMRLPWTYGFVYIWRPQERLPWPKQIGAGLAPSLLYIEVGKREIQNKGNYEEATIRWDRPPLFLLRANSFGRSSSRVRRTK
jgi:hypothetical protein